MCEQDEECPPHVRIADDYKLTYLGSTISDNLSLDAKLNKRFEQEDFHHLFTIKCKCREAAWSVPSYTQAD